MGRPGQLPQFQSEDKDFQLMQGQWAALLNPLLKNPFAIGNLLQSVPLTTGDNTINHKLGRTPQGFIITDLDAASDIYRSQPFNNLTLTLNASAPTTVGLYVF